MLPARKSNLEKEIEKEQRELRGLHLPYRQRRLVALYDGSNVNEIARLLGVVPDTVRSWLKDQRVIDALARRDEIEDTPVVASRVERKEFWSHVMNGEVFDMKNRLKASELLGRSECDFSETRVLKGAGAATTVIVNTGVPRAPGEPQSPDVSVQKGDEKQDVDVDVGEEEATVIITPSFDEVF